MIGNTKGLTLVEVLVATAIVGVTMIMAVSVWFLVTQSQDQNADLLYQQSVGRQLLQQIEADVRNNLLDYDYYPGAFPGDQLALRTPANEPVVYWFQTGRVLLCTGKAPGTSCSTSTPGDWERVTPTSIILDAGFFDLMPSDSPYPSGTTAAPQSNQAVLVTVRLMLAAEASEAVLLQDSFTSRAYVR